MPKYKKYDNLSYPIKPSPEPSLSDSKQNKSLNKKETAKMLKQLRRNSSSIRVIDMIGLISSASGFAYYNIRMFLDPEWCDRLPFLFSTCYLLMFCLFIFYLVKVSGILHKIFHI